MEQESLAQGVARREQEHRSARIARVDETARLLFVRCAVLTDKSVTGLQGIVDSELDAKKCYGHAIALERARDEAIEDLDSIPPRGEK